MIAGSRRGALLACASLLFSVLAASPACSSKNPAQFASAGDDAGIVEAGDDASGSSSGGSGNSSGGINLEGGGGSGGGLGTGSCKDGMYSGMFQCSFIFGDAGAADAGFDGGGFLITGTISFTLTQNTGTGETFIDTASGMLGGNCCLGLFSISATVGGTLNCNSGVFSGSLSNGMYTGFAMTGPFSGPLGASYDGTTSSFVNGTWNLSVPMYGNCVGVWTANYTDQ